MDFVWRIAKCWSRFHWTIWSAQSNRQRENIRKRGQCNSINCGRTSSTLCICCKNEPDVQRIRYLTEASEREREKENLISSDLMCSTCTLKQLPAIVFIHKRVPCTPVCDTINRLPFIHRILFVFAFVCCFYDFPIRLFVSSWRIYSVAFKKCCYFPLFSIKIIALSTNRPFQWHSHNLGRNVESISVLRCFSHLGLSPPFSLFRSLFAVSFSSSVHNRRRIDFLTKWINGITPNLLL